MELKRGDIVMLDTNVMIEAHRVSCWKALANAFQLKTVTRCVQEAINTRMANRPDYVEVPLESLESRIDIHDLTEMQIAQLLQRASGLAFAGRFHRQVKPSFPCHVKTRLALNRTED